MSEQPEKQKLDEERFRLIAGMVTDILFEYDIQSDRLMTSKFENGEFGKKRYIEQPEFTLRKQIYPGDTDLFVKFMRELKAGKKKSYVELRVCGKDGGYSWFLFEGYAQPADGTPQRIVGRASRIAEKDSRDAREHNIDRRDQLTRVLKSDCITEILNLYFQGKPQGNAAVLMLDMDDFDEINKTMGHLFGDEILADAAKAISGQLQEGDRIGRTGGDEFLICMKNVKDRTEVDRRAADIQKAIHALYIGEHHKKALSASIGIALYPEDGEELDSLRGRASDVLRRIKANGKDAWAINGEDTGAYMQMPEPENGKDEYTTFEKSYDERYDQFGYELAELAFRLMEEETDVDSIINLLLHKTADYYELSAVCIRELTDRPNTARVSYEYLRRDYSRSDLGKDKYMPEQQWEFFRNKYRNGYYLYEKDDCSEETAVERYKSEEALQTLLQIPVYKKNHFAGSIDFCDAYKKRRWSSSEIHTLKLFARIISGYLMNMRDYQDTVMLVERMQETDALTGLYKFDVFLAKLQEEIDAGRAEGICLVYSDIRHFKYINENFGYGIGDRLLKDFAGGLKNSGEHTYLFGSRVYSDNLVSALRLAGQHDPEYLRSGVQQFNQAFTSRVRRRFVNSSLNINSGIYLLKQEDTAKSAVSNANLARKYAKENGENRPVIFDESMLEEIDRQMKFASMLPDAIQDHELKVYFQPKVDCGSGQIIGAEALVRWQRKDGGFYYPDEFIPIFEKNGSIAEVDYYVYRETFAWLRKRLDEGSRVVPVSMNVSRVHLKSDAVLDYIASLIREYRIPPELLEFELTENIYIENMESVLPMIFKMRQSGLKVAMDDFGSGYSSLNMLNHLPIDVLKLDKVFLKKGTLEEGDKIILTCVVEMAKRLHITVLCEGVETEEQSRFLQSIGCDIIQGYYYGKPMPQADFESILERKAQG